MRRAVLGCVMVFGVAACGRTGTVTGTVSYKNTPLTSGTIQFMGSDGAAYPGLIKPNGTYSVSLPRGEAKVVISCVDEEKAKDFGAKIKGSSGQGGGRAKAADLPAANFSLIPSKYSNWETSGLTVNVRSGTNKHDFELTD